MMRFLVEKWACNHCSEEHKYYLEFIGEKIQWHYEGCGGYMGRASKRHGTEVSRDEAIELLRARQKEIGEEIDESRWNAQDIKRKLKELCAKEES